MRGAFITLEGGEGVGKSTNLEFVANTLKDWPETVALIETLMRERGLNPDQFNQASIGVTASGVSLRLSPQ